MKDINALDLEELLEHDLSHDDLKSLLDLVALASWWVSPSVYQSLQIVYPKTRRKKGQESRGQIIDDIRLWFNEPASHAFWLGMGKTTREMTNFYVCHIYEKSVWNPNHFTNLANMSAFPKCLQSLSEWKPIADVLKYHSYKIYGYKGLEDKIPEPPEYYPESWLHVHDPNSEEMTIIIRKLREQSTTRPTFNSKDNF